jgi:hypothetical protein
MLELFPREQILLLRSEELERDAHAAMIQVAEFLGVAPPTRDSIRPHPIPVTPEVFTRNTYGTVLKQDHKELLRDLLKQDSAEFAALTGWNVSTWTSGTLS